MKFLNENNIYLISSNKNKLKEFKRFGLNNLEIKSGVDLPEILSNSDNVAIYKSKTAGKNTIIEDTILEINGKEIVDIRWKINELDNSNAIWKTTLGYNDGEYIKLYVGIIKGKIKKPKEVPLDSFGFDSYFYPNNSDKSLYQLEKEGKKDLFSARKMAVDNFLSNKVYKQQKLDKIKDWNGKFQH